MSPSASCGNRVRAAAFASNIEVCGCARVSPPAPRCFSPWNRAAWLSSNAARAAAGATPAATSAAAAPIRARAAARSSAPASTTSASTSSSRTRTATRSAICRPPTSTSSRTTSRRKIDTFKLIKLDGGTADAIKEPPKEIRNDFDEESEAARDDVRLFAIFLDDYHVRRGTSMAVRGQLSQVHRHPDRAVRHDRRDVSARGDRIGPHDPQSLGGLARAAAVPRAQVRVRAEEPVRRAVRALPDRDGRADPQSGVAVGAQGADRPHGLAEGRAQVADSRQRGLHQHGAAADAQRRRAAAGPRQSQPVQPERRRRTTSTRIAPPGRPASTWIRTCARSTTPPTATTSRSTPSIRAACPASSSTSTRASACRPTRKYLTSTMDSLRTLAENTDGRAIVNRNDIVTGMKQITRDSSAYYLIGYNSAQAPTDGKFHEIKVKVKRPGVQVRARRGYWALNREEVARATAPPKPRAAQAGRSRDRQRRGPPVARERRALLGRHVARRERQDARDLRLGAAAEVARRSPARGAGARVADGGRAGRLAVLPRQGARRRARVHRAGISGRRRRRVDRARGPSRVSFDVPPGEDAAAHLGGRRRVAGARQRDARDQRARSDVGAGDRSGRPSVLRARTVREFQQLRTDGDAVPIAGPRVQPDRTSAGPSSRPTVRAARRRR